MLEPRRYVIYRHLLTECLGYIIRDLEIPNYAAWEVGTFTQQGIAIIPKEDVVRTATLEDFDKHRVRPPPHYRVEHAEPGSVE